MRIFLATILLICFTVQSLYSAGVTAWFYLNRAEIIAKSCVNKSRPEMKCHGSCQLKKKLQEAERNDEKPAEALKEWTSISPCILTISNLVFNTDIPDIFYPESPVILYSHRYLSAIFHPPVMIC